MLSFAVLVAPVLLFVVACKDPDEEEFDVFLSFSSEEAAMNFADSLYNGLVNADIRVFEGDDWLCRGKKIARDRVQAIKNSKILIPILSPGYCASERCLDELVQIMDCKNDSSGHIVLPIFRKMEGSNRFDQNEEQKRALTEVSSSKGWESEKVANGDGGQLVELVVRKVLIELKKALEPIISENSVGIKSPMEKIMKFLDSRGSTLYVGIHGEGGVGKTTLAKVIYNKLSERFDHCSFIPNVTESCKCNSIEYLRNQLIWDLEGKKECGKNQPSATISLSFRRMKVLIVLDDVNTSDQLENLAGERNWFAPGSRIIITTRKKSVLDLAKVDYKHEHKAMEKDEAEILFARHAFQMDYPPEEFSALSDEVISIVNWFPLTLEIIGSYLCGKSSASWKETKEKLRESQLLRQLQELQRLVQDLQELPRMETQEILQESRELPRMETQELPRMETQEILQESRELPRMETRELPRMETQEILQESRVLPRMETQEILQESRELPRMETRELPRMETQEILHLLQELQELPRMETQEILKIVYGALEIEQKNIFLDIACFLVGSDARIASCMWETSGFNLELGIEELIFMSLIKIGDNHELRMHDEVRDFGRSIVREGHCNEPDNGRRLWDHEDVLKMLDENEGTENIRGLSLDKGNSRPTLNLDSSNTNIQFKNLASLRFLSVSDANFVGDFDNIFSELRWLRWERCPEELQAERFAAEKLTVLDLSRSKISDNWKGWESIKSEKLKVLNLTGCDSLKTTFFLSKFKHLEILILRKCKNLHKIFPSIGDLKTLVSLDLSGCSCLQVLPTEVGNLKGLKELFLDQTEITHIPHEIWSLVRLQRFSLQSCRLETLHSNSIAELESLTELVLTDTKITELPDSIGNLQNLGMLNIRGTGIEKLRDAIGRLSKLRLLNASSCVKLSKITESIRYLSSLQSLDLRYCSELKDLPELPSNLTVVSVTCTSDKLPPFSHLNHLKQLRLYNCESLKCIPELPSTTLELEISGCKSLEFLTPPEAVKDFAVSLKRLDIIRCTSLGKLDLSQLNLLRVLYALDCKKIHEIGGLDKLDSLESLTIQGDDSIELDKPFSSLLKRAYY